MTVHDRTRLIGQLHPLYTVFEQELEIDLFIILRKAAKFDDGARCISMHCQAGSAHDLYQSGIPCGGRLGAMKISASRWGSSDLSPCMIFPARGLRSIPAYFISRRVTRDSYAVLV